MRDRERPGPSENQAICGTDSKESSRRGSTLTGSISLRVSRKGHDPVLGGFSLLQPHGVVARLF